MGREIRVAIAGVGNAASALVQSVYYYSEKSPEEIVETAGLIYTKIGDYEVRDIKFVAAFDIDERKVGKDLSEAIYAPPNCLPINICKVPKLDVEVMMGPVMDGAPKHLQETPVYKGGSEYVLKVAKKKPVDAVDVLKEARADVLVNLIPTGSYEAARYYANAAIEAGVSFINGIPELIVSDKKYQQLAEEKKVPLIGDDVKSQIGATILHRALISLLLERGIKIKETYQLNYGGDTDFSNLIKRGETKEMTKLSAIESLVPYKIEATAGFGFIRTLGDTKIAIIKIVGEKCGGVPVEIEAKLTVIDGYNSAGVLIDAIRCAKLAMDRKIGGPLISASAYLMKHPPVQYPDAIARRMLEEFIRGERER